MATTNVMYVYRTYLLTSLCFRIHPASAGAGLCCALLQHDTWRLLRHLTTRPQGLDVSRRRRRDAIVVDSDVKQRQRQHGVCRVDAELSSFKSFRRYSSVVRYSRTTGRLSCVGARYECATQLYNTDCTGFCYLAFIGHFKYGLLGYCTFMYPLL